jgi:aspartate aminotransferase
VSAPIQYAAVEAYHDHRELDIYRRTATGILKSVSNYCTDQLHACGVTVSRGEGGFYLFPDFSSYSKEFKKNNINTSTQLCHRILHETGVALLPGIAFGRPEEEYTVRLSFVDFDGTNALTQWKEDMGDADFNLLFPKIKEGISALLSWIRNLKSICI